MIPTQVAPSRTSDGAAADRRPVTVLFADLAGFTTLGERLDAEEVRALQSELFRDMASVIADHAGFFEKFVGDAVMAVFGAPTAHEDDPERALRAALAMHERVATLGRRWAGRLGSPLALHVGVNTGPVVAGTLGSTPDAAYAVTGDTVNVASRLQGAAEPGQTLVGAVTYRLTQHAFALESIGEIALKGKAERVPAYRLLGLLDAPRPARGLAAHGMLAPLVGREGELAQLLAALDRVEGRAEMVSVIGEAGAGKSRLLGEFFARLEATGRLPGLVVRRAACSSLGERTYGVLAAFFREGYGVATDDPLQVAEQKLRAGLERLGVEGEEEARIVSVLRYVLGLESDTEPDPDPERLKRRIFWAWRALVAHRLAHGPLVLVVEDVHWADAASVELLRFMVERLAGHRLMVLFTYRPSFAARVLLAGQATHTVIRLAPLSPADSESLLGALFAQSAARLPPALRALIIHRGGGNPFFLEEIIRGLLAAGVLVRRDDGWRCVAEIGAIDVPVTVHGLLLSRLDRLPASTRRLAQEASVLGSTFEEHLLRMIASAPSACRSDLERLEAAEVLEEVARAPGADGSQTTAGRRYRFIHALVHEVIYQNLLVRERTEVHARAGQALEALCERAEQPRRLEDLAALGYHFSLSAEKLKGARYLVAAGDRARALYANDDAVRHYEQALGALEGSEAGEAERQAVWERLGDLHSLMGRREAGLREYAAVLRAAEASGDRLTQARVFRKVGGLYWNAGERDRARATLESGLALLEGDGEHIELAHLYQEMGRLAFRSGDNVRAIAWAERALTQAKRREAVLGGVGVSTEESARDVGAAVSHAYNTLGIAFARTGRLEAAVEHMEQSVAVAEAHGLLHVACRGYANLGVLYSTADPRRAIETCRRGLEIAKKIGDVGFQSRLYANLAVAYCAFTNRCDADGVAAAQAAIDLDRRLVELDHLAVPLIVLGQIYQCHGDAELALRYYQEALGLAEEVGEPQLLFPCYDGLATVHLDRGDPARAEKYLRKAQEVCERAGLEPDSFMVLPFLS